jgi:ankyrin repeat protein
VACIPRLAQPDTNLEIAQYLIDNGASACVDEDTGMPILSFYLTQTAAHSILVAMKNLILLGADVNAQLDDGTTVLHFAARGSNLNMLQYLILHGADVQAKNSEGDTPLRCAVSSSQDFWQDELDELDQDALAMIKCLVSQGADVLAKNNDGKTPLDVAKEQENAPVVEYLNANSRTEPTA